MLAMSLRIRFGFMLSLLEGFEAFRRNRCKSILSRRKSYLSSILRQIDPPQSLKHLPRCRPPRESSSSQLSFRSQCTRS